MFKHLILVSVFLIVSSAIPNENTSPDKALPPSFLTRPTPINPNIPSDPKPQDKIIPIPEGHEIKQKRETDQKNDATSTQHPPLPGPLNLQNSGQYPSIPEHLQFKRDSLDKTSSTPVPTNLRNPSTLTKESHKDNSHEHSNEHDHQYKRENTKQSATTNAPKIASTKQLPGSEGNHEMNRRPYVPQSQQSRLQNHNKRDIPVPVTESEKERTSAASTTAKTNDKSTQQPSHPAVLSQPVPVAQLLRTKSE